MQREGGVSALESLVDLNEAISCNFQVASVVGGGARRRPGFIIHSGSARVCSTDGRQNIDSWKLRVEPAGHFNNP